LELSPDFIASDVCAVDVGW